MLEVVIFASSFTLVFLKAVQQQNVIGGHYALAAITSFLIALSEVSLLLSVVSKGWSSFLIAGLGGSLGVITAMVMHKKIVSTFDKMFK